MTQIDLHFQFLELSAVCMHQAYEIFFPPGNQSLIFLGFTFIGWLRYQLIHCIIMRRKVFEHKQANNYDTIHAATTY